MAADLANDLSLRNSNIIRYSGDTKTLATFQSQFDIQLSKDGNLLYYVKTNGFADGYVNASGVKVTDDALIGLKAQYDVSLFYKLIAFIDDQSTIDWLADTYSDGIHSRGLAAYHALFAKKTERTPAEISAIRAEITEHSRTGIRNGSPTAFNEWLSVLNKLNSSLPREARFADGALARLYVDACARFIKQLIFVVSRVDKAFGVEPMHTADTLRQLLVDESTYQDLAVKQEETAALAAKAAAAAAASAKKPPYSGPTEWKPGMDPCMHCHGNHLHRDCTSDKAKEWKALKAKAKTSGPDKPIATAVTEAHYDPDSWYDAPYPDDPISQIFEVPGTYVLHGGAFSSTTEPLTCSRVDTDKKTSSIEEQD